MADRISDEEINFLLEDIPEDNGGFTDEESDDDEGLRISYDNDRLFKERSPDIILVIPPTGEDEQKKPSAVIEEQRVTVANVASTSTDQTNFDRIFDEELDRLDDAVEESPLQKSQANLDLEPQATIDSDNEQRTVTTVKLDKVKATKSTTAKKKRPMKKAAVKKGKKQVDRKWRKHNKETVIPPYTGKPPGPVEGMFDSCKTPTDFFIQTINPVLDKIVYETNLYAVQRGKTLATDRKEFLSFLGINFLMGYKVLPSWKDYWSTSPDLGCPQVMETMSRNRFDLILSNLHINDNTSRPNDCKDRLYKIRPLIDGLNDQFIQIYNVNRDVAVDESTILFKGRSTLKQYNPMKPIKRGYKLWCIADGKGYVPQFEIYQGKGGQLVDDDLENFGPTERVVLRLTKPYWQTNIKLYFDNFYSSLPLLEKLTVEKVLACGTIRADRVGLPTFPDTKMSRGDYDFRLSNLDIAVFKWMDNRPVVFISNYHGSTKASVKRKNNKGEKLDISCPEVVRDYNIHMGGVDLADQLRQYYCVNRRSKKWWHRLFWGMMDFAFVNSFVIYNCLKPKLSVLEYRRAVAQGLMAKKQKNQAQKRKSKEGNVPQPKRGKTGHWSVSNDIRLGNRGVHYVVFSEKRGRCEVCSVNKIESRPYSTCKMCKVHLCLNDKKNCFKDFHELV